MGITYSCDNFKYSPIFDGIESEMLLFLSNTQHSGTWCTQQQHQLLIIVALTPLNSNTIIPIILNQQHLTSN